MSPSFRALQSTRLATSGWAKCPSIAASVAAAGLQPITHEYLNDAFSSSDWSTANEAVTALHAHFSTARFAADVTYGLLLVPDPDKLDTRQAMPARVRRDQLDTPADDVFDQRLPVGTRTVGPGTDWILTATVTSTCGPALGSHQQVITAPARDFTVLGTDTRILMTRQLWGARVLQSGHQLPDSDRNERWTFTLFPGEPLTDGYAESGTVLHGKIRFRLGQPSRGIGSARIAPAIIVS